MQGNARRQYRGYGGECRDGITNFVLLRNVEEALLLDVILMHVRNLEAEHS